MKNSLPLLKLIFVFIVLNSLAVHSTRAEQNPVAARIAAKNG